MFLVIVRFTEGDLPVRLFSDRVEAEAFAAGLTGQDVGDALDVVYHVGGKTRYVYVLEFHGGRPAGARQIKRFEGVSLPLDL